MKSIAFAALMSLFIFVANFKSTSQDETLENFKNYFNNKLSANCLNVILTSYPPMRKEVDEKWTKVAKYVKAQPNYNAQDEKTKQLLLCCPAWEVVLDVGGAITESSCSQDERNEYNTFGKYLMDTFAKTCSLVPIGSMDCVVDSIPTSNPVDPTDPPGQLGFGYITNGDISGVSDKCAHEIKKEVPICNTKYVALYTTKSTFDKNVKSSDPATFKKAQEKYHCCPIWNEYDCIKSHLPKYCTENDTKVFENEYKVSLETHLKDICTSYTYESGKCGDHNYSTGLFINYWLLWSVLSFVLVNIHKM